VAHGVVFVSGQLPYAQGRKLVPGSIGEQTAQCVRNIAAALEGHGLTLRDIVKTTVWLARASDFEEFDLAYRREMGEPAPARSTVQATLMVDALIEIEDCG
jgi:enamine deaminase RidA (YjgF/YER057c/UK114 family)